MKDIRVHEHLAIPASEIELTFSRSSGPGGQNVNKVNSKVTLRWDLANSQVLSPVVLLRLQRLAGSRLATDGSLQVVSQEHRDQGANIRECNLKLQRLVLQALQPPKTRKATRPTAGATRRRLQEKNQRSQTKADRSSKNWD